MKLSRHSEILNLISQNNIETQEDLVAALNKKGFNVTQATVSRDIRELGLTKAVLGGKQRYVRYVKTPEENNRLYVLSQGIISITPAANILVIKTDAGMASAICAAIDDMELSFLIGTIAGDDTIMAVAAGDKQAEEAKFILEEYIKREGHLLDSKPAY